MQHTHILQQRTIHFIQVIQQQFYFLNYFQHYGDNARKKMHFLQENRQTISLNVATVFAMMTTDLLKFRYCMCMYATASRPSVLSCIDFH